MGVIYESYQVSEKPREEVWGQIVTRVDRDILYEVLDEVNVELTDGIWILLREAICEKMENNNDLNMFRKTDSR